MWIIGLILGAALLLAGIFVKTQNPTPRRVLSVLGGIIIGVSIIYFLLVVILLNGIQ